MKARILLTLGLFALIAASAAYAQPLVVKAQIDFPFTVEGKVLPAGTYEFTRDDAASAFRVTDGGKNAALALVLTRLAAVTHTTSEDAHVIFDKVGDAYTLAEIWLPGLDGYVLASTKGKHEHKVVNVKY